MTDEQLKALQDALDLKRRELALVMAIDEIRDTAPDPTNMLQQIVDLLVNVLPADLCLMFLKNRETGAIEPKAVSDRTGGPSQWREAITRELAARATGLDHVATWEGREVLSGATAADAPENLQLAAVPIILNKDERLGALLLGRSRRPFDPHDVQLLTTAEDQIDSAVIQGYLYEKHQRSLQEIGLRRKELALITAIDEIRDNLPEPGAMLTAIADLLAERLDADLCLIFLLDRETGAVELKAMNDRGGDRDRWQHVITRELATHAAGLDHVTLWAEGEKLPLEPPLKVPEGLHLAGVPIILNHDERLGALLLARSGLPFGPQELQLLATAEDQIDSAVIQGHLHDQHQLSAKELETIYQVDRLRDLGLPLDEMLNRVLEILIARIDAEMGFVMLYDRTGQQLETRATTHQDLLQTWHYHGVIQQIVDESLAQARLICRNDLDDGVRSVMCLPLILNEQIIGVLGVVNRYAARGFSAADCRLLNAIGSQIDTAIYERREMRRLRQVLGRSIDPRVMEQLLANPHLDILKPERLDLTVLYADLRGSTLLAERVAPELLAEFIRDYLTQMTDVILAHEGTVDKFVGDEVMALFGAPIPQEDHALRAVRAGLAMQAVHQTIIENWQRRDVRAPPIGVGIATGRMIVGEMGSPQRVDYTVIGREANLGARICGVARGGQVLISEATFERVREAVEAIPLPGQQFKGVAGDVTVYQVTHVHGGNSPA